MRGFCPITSSLAYPVTCSEHRVYIFDMSFHVGNEHNIDALINSSVKSSDFFLCLFALSGVLFKRLNFSSSFAATTAR